MNADSRSWLWLAVLLVTGWLIYLLAPVITPFAISAVLAYFGDPLVDRWEKAKVWRWTLGRTLAVSIVFVLMFCLLAIVLLLLVPMLVDQVRLLVQRFPAWIEWVSGTVLPWISANTGYDIAHLETSEFTGMARDYWREISGAAFKVVDIISRGGTAVVTVLTNLILIPVVTFYLLRDWDGLVRGIRDLLPRRIEPEIGRAHV